MRVRVVVAGLLSAASPATPLLRRRTWSSSSPKTNFLKHPIPGFVVSSFRTAATRRDRERKRRGEEPSVSSQLVSDDDLLTAPLAADGAAASDQKHRRLPKRKVALLLGYDGTGYFGFQIQKGPQADKLPTVEGELRRALEAARAVSASNAVDLGKTGWSRAARTDKGVSAARQIVAFKLELAEDDSEAKVVDRINAALPPAIRVFDAVRVTKHFDAKRACDHRSYAYMLPEIMLASRRDVVAVFADVVLHPAAASSSSSSTGEDDREEQGEAADNNARRLEAHLRTLREQIVAAKRRHDSDDDDDDDDDDPEGTSSSKKRVPKPDSGVAWKLTDAQRRDAAARLAALPPVSRETVERLRRVLRAYVGTKNFHNFTARVRADDPAVKRFVMSFEVDDEASSKTDGWLRLSVLGQSFMLHQIRKMVAVAARAAVDETKQLDNDAQARDLIDALTQPTFRLPLQLAPGEGLYLGEPHFASYNDFKVSSKKNNNNDAAEASSSSGNGKSKLEWDQDHPKFKDIDAFRTQVVERAILKDGSLDALLPFVDHLWQVLVFGFPISPDDPVLDVNNDQAESSSNHHHLAAENHGESGGASSSDDA